jgi:glucan 1,3-beta-glucosidase
MPFLRSLVLSTILIQAALCIQFEIPIVGDIVAAILTADSRYVHFQGNATANVTVDVRDLPNLAKRQSSSYWYENIAHQGISAFGPAGYQVFRNVRDFGARGTFRLKFSFSLMSKILKIN